MWGLLAFAFGAPTLAVADLTNETGQERMEPAGTGAAAILVTKFSSIDAIQVVERSRLEAVLAEINLSQSGVVDPEHAVEAGRLLGADFLVFGSIIGFEEGAVIVHLNVVDTKTSAVLVADDVHGSLGADGSGFFDLVNELGDRIVMALSVELSPEEERAFQTARMREFEALLQYGNADQEAKFEVLGATLARCGSTAAAGTKDAHRAVLAARIEGRTNAETFAGCLRQVDGLLDPEARSDFWTWNLKSAMKKIEEPIAAEIIEGLATRPPEVDFPVRLVKRARKQMGRSKSSHAADLLRALELDEGTLDGTPVDSEGIANAEEAMLAWFARRLPNEIDRNAAAENLVRIRVANSPFSVVRERADTVVSEVLETGSYALPEDLRVASASWAPSKPLTLTVSAKPMKASANLRLESDGQVSSSLSMEGLSAVVDGLEGPVLLCPPVRPFDPTPCLESSRVLVEDDRLGVNNGRVAIPTQVPIDGLVELIRDGDMLLPNLTVDGVAVSGLEIPLQFKPVPSLLLRGGQGAKGPNITVDLYSIRHGRVLVGVQGTGNSWGSAAVVPYRDARFTAGSAGGRGLAGQKGQDGAPGTAGVPGFPGTCETDGGDGQDGGDGLPGAPGGNGGPGADGGDVLVVLHCEEDCAELEAFARNRVQSFGGPGGSGGNGGSGGSGGDGGEGGDGARCEVVSDSGSTSTKSTWDGSNGSRGSNGSMGERGQEGPDGSPGRVEITVAR